MLACLLGGVLCGYHLVVGAQVGCFLLFWTTLSEVSFGVTLFGTTLKAMSVSELWGYVGFFFAKIYQTNSKYLPTPLEH